MIMEAGKELLAHLAQLRAQAAGLLKGSEARSSHKHVGYGQSPY